MYRTIRTSLILFVMFTALTGLVYPLLITGAAQVFFPHQANGSLLRNAQGEVVGSSLIGQQFDQVRYFWGRPSATSDHPYRAAASGGANASVLSEALQTQVKERLAALQAADPGNTQPVPIDLVTSSASGLDPHISPAAARYQAARVARARGLSLEQVQALIEQHIEQPVLGLLGEPRVNVLLLNLALDSLQ